MSDFEKMDLATIVRLSADEVGEATLYGRKRIWNLDKRLVEVTAVPMGVTNADYTCDGWLCTYDQSLQPRLYFRLDSGDLGALLKAASEIKKPVSVQGELKSDKDSGRYFLDLGDGGVKFGELELGYER